MARHSPLPPHDLVAERAAIGCAILDRHAYEKMTAAGIVADDFYASTHQTVWAIIERQWRTEGRADQLTISRDPAIEEEARQATFELCAGCVADVPAISNAARYAAAIVAHSKRRLLIFEASDVTKAAYEEQDPDVIARGLAERLSSHAGLVRDTAGIIRGFHHSIDDMDTGEDRDVAQPAVFVGLLRRQQRLAIVAPGGAGKSFLMRQAAYCAENGRHWLSGLPGPTSRALLVELESADWDIIPTTRIIRRRLGYVCGGRELRAPAVLHRTGGFDLRDRRNLWDLEQVMRTVRPNLMCIGPIKYLYTPGENYETAALEIQAVLNDLVTRFDCALILEAHSNKNDPSGPSGSQRWHDWPDTGFALTLEGERAGGIMSNPWGKVEFQVEPFRNLRDTTVYLPQSIWRNNPHQPLPWTAPNVNVILPDEDDPFRTANGKLYDLWRTPTPAQNAIAAAAGEDF